MAAGRCVFDGVGQQVDEDLLNPHFVGDQVRQVQSLDGVILGGESGHGARPMHPQWPRDIRDTCAEAGVQFFFKQWGEWAPIDPRPSVQTDPRSRLAEMARIGKKRAGRELDGVTHDALPEAMR